jgi:MFS family permease
LTDAKKGGLAAVFLTVLIDLIGFGIVLPNLAFFASGYGASPFVVGLLYSSYSVAQLFFSPIWGALSDRIGRRPVMLVSTLGSALSYILLGFSNSIALLFLSRILAGVMAGNISTAQAYVSDVTTPENRARGMGMIGAAFGIGFVLGPAIGAGLAHVPVSGAFFASYPHALVGFFSSALSAASFLLVIFVLPESLNRTARAAVADDARPVKMSVFRPSFWKFVADREKGQGLPLLFFCMFMATFGQASIYGAFPLFCKENLRLSPAAVGMQYVWVGLIAVFVQGGFIRPLVKRFGEKPLFVVGNAVMTAGLALIPLARSQGALFAFIGLMATGWSLSLPTLTSLISKRSDPRFYGATLGASQALSALGRAVGPGWGGLLFGWHYQLPFFLTAALVSTTVIAGFRFSDT